MYQNKNLILAFFYFSASIQSQPLTTILMSLRQQAFFSLWFIIALVLNQRAFSICVLGVSCQNGLLGCGMSQFEFAGYKRPHQKVWAYVIHVPFLFFTSHFLVFFIFLKYLSSFNPFHFHTLTLFTGTSFHNIIMFCKKKLYKKT